LSMSDRSWHLDRDYLGREGPWDKAQQYLFVGLYPTQIEAQLSDKLRGLGASGAGTHSFWQHSVGDKRSPLACSLVETISNRLTKLAQREPILSHVEPQPFIRRVSSKIGFQQTLGRVSVGPEIVTLTHPQKSN
jgi:hypothetical protein